MESVGDLQKMIKVKKPLDHTNFNLGYRIVAVTEELVQKNINKEKKHTQWIGVEIATIEDIQKYGRKGEGLEVEDSTTTQLVSDTTDSNKQLVEMDVKLSEATEKAEFAAMENEELKKRIAELKEKQKVSKDKKEETKTGEGAK